MATLSGLHFFVADMARTLAFYRMIGIEIPPSEEVSDPDGTVVGFHSPREP